MRSELLFQLLDLAVRLLQGGDGFSSVFGLSINFMATRFCDALAPFRRKEEWLPRSSARSWPKRELSSRPVFNLIPYSAPRFKNALLMAALLMPYVCAIFETERNWLFGEPNNARRARAFAPMQVEAPPPGAGPKKDHS
jgi:hypothetical protein